MKKILTMKKVTKTFGSGHTKVSALKAIDFYVKEGEFVSIIGPSGSGKSTFLTISGGLQTPTSGEIVINGHSLTELPEKKRADLRFKEIGFILQSSNLIPFLIIFTIHVKTEKKKKEGKNDDHREETESYFHADNIEFIKLCAIICNSRHYR